jgi:hypothetical protein
LKKYYFFDIILIEIKGEMIMANKITEEQKLQMNILYQKYHTYAAVARELGVAPTTVKKYIIPNFEMPQEENIERFDTANLPDFDISAFENINWSNCAIFGDEFAEIKELWKEIAI